MKEVRILSSSPDYEEINELTIKIGMLKNPHMHKIDMPEVERKVAIAEHEEYLEGLLNFQNLPFNKLIK